MQKGFLGRFRLTQVFQRSPAMDTTVRSAGLRTTYLNVSVPAIPHRLHKPLSRGKSNGNIHHSVAHNTAFYTACYEKRTRYKIRETTHSKKQTHTGLAPYFCGTSDKQHNNLLFLLVTCTYFRGCGKTPALPPASHGLRTLVPDSESGYKSRFLTSW